MYTNSKLISLILVLLTSFRISTGFSQDKKVSLRVGDNAPAIQNVAWFKGEPISSFKKGHVYIVEFGYIGCSGCNISIPHLSEIAQRYEGKATLISVFVHEKYSRMKRFVESMGNKIQYRVALDKEEHKTMEITWINASAMNGYPTAFIIDQNGKIVWMGNPEKGGGIDEAIDETIQGRLPEEGLKKLYLTGSYVYAALQAEAKGDLRVAISILDFAISQNPDYQPFYMIKLNYLLQSNEEKGYEFSWAMLQNQFKDDPTTLHRFISDKIFSFYEKGIIKTPDWDLVIALNERALEVNQYELHAFSMHKQISDAFVQKKEYDKATQIIEMALADLKNGGFNKEESNGLENYLLQSLENIEKIKQMQRP